MLCDPSEKGTKYVTKDVDCLCGIYAFLFPLVATQLVPYVQTSGSLCDPFMRDSLDYLTMKASTSANAMLMPCRSKCKC